MGESTFRAHAVFVHAQGARTAAARVEVGFSNFELSGNCFQSHPTEREPSQERIEHCFANGAAGPQRYLFCRPSVIHDLEMIAQKNRVPSGFA